MLARRSPCSRKGPYRPTRTKISGWPSGWPIRTRQTLRASISPALAVTSPSGPFCLAEVELLEILNVIELPRLMSSSSSSILAVNW